MEQNVALTNQVDELTATVKDLNQTIRSEEGAQEYLTIINRYNDF